jgi:hypothetical protein
MLLSFVIAVYWCFVYTIVGYIVLACVPALGLTLHNLIVFVIGALPGSLAFLYAVALLDDHVAYRLGALEKYPIAFSLLGAIASGTLLVWLKMRLTFD